METKGVEENRDPRWLLGFICESTWLMSNPAHWEEAGALEMIKIWPYEFTDSMGEHLHGLRAGSGGDRIRAWSAISQG